VDEPTREALTIPVERRIDADATVAVLDRLVAEHPTAPRERLPVQRFPGFADTEKGQRFKLCRAHQHDADQRKRWPDAWRDGSLQVRGP